jgi:hypothetical protein
VRRNTSGDRSGGGSDGEPTKDATLLAGIAAADVICCARLGVHAEGLNHNEAVNLLASTDKTASRDLATLLGLKTRSGYSAQQSSRSDRTRARRAAQALVERAEQVG